jgi:hypothetical protein
MKTIAIKKNPISHPQPATEGRTEDAQKKQQGQVYTFDIKDCDW